LNARNLFAPATAANPNKPVFRRNQFGFVLGGPVIKDKTFFFGDYQGTRQQIARVRTSTVPTLAQRQGNFSFSLGAPLFFQSNGSISMTVTANPVNISDTNGNTIQARVGQIFRPSDHRAYAGNLIPTNTFDPIAAELLKRYPNPTISPASEPRTPIRINSTLVSIIVSRSRIRSTDASHLQRTSPHRSLPFPMVVEASIPESPD
jgi:hypothetical protein